MTQPTVSKLIAALERHLGGSLFVRSTRHLSLTAEGRRFYDQCRSIVDTVEGAETSFKSGREEVAGDLRIASSVSFGRTQLMPRMRAFMQRFPALRIELELNDRFVSIIEEGIDVAFRIGELKDSSLIARRVGTTYRITVGTPEYFRRNGEPGRPEDLGAHNCILYTGLASRNVWSYLRDGRAHSVRVAGSFHTNSAEAVRAAALDGIGIAYAPVWLFGDDVRAKRLKVVLADYRPRPLPIHAVLPVSRRNSAKVRSCVEFFQAEFAADPLVSEYRI